MAQPGKLHRDDPAPTPMGERILAFVKANYITDLEEFAEGLVGVPLATLESWIYVPMDPAELPVGPMLVCAEALGTNADFLICASDDPRPGFQLTYDEAVLLQAFRDIAREEDRDRLLKTATQLLEASTPEPNMGSPFPRVPVRRNPPANEA